jgi:adenosylcobinamide-GDP ribazoletransferase
MIQNFLLALSFFTRLPACRDFKDIRLSQCAFAFPLAGAVIGALGGAVFLMALGLGLTSSISAWVSIIFGLILTGGLHEDGLADTADGLACGRNREQKLAIMRDSRIGSYGVLALISFLSLRVAVISNLAGNFETMLIFIAAAAGSRAFIVVLMNRLEPARKEGLAEAAGKPSMRQTIAAILLGILILAAAGDIITLISVIIITAVTYLMIKPIIYKNFGGITGDTLGAAQQVSEIIILLILSPHLLT